MSKQNDFHAMVVTERLGTKNQWVELGEGVKWSRFEKLLWGVDETGAEGGRPRYDVTVMFRMVLLGQWHDLSDREVEQALRVRLDFMVFCGLNLSSEVPDQNTVQLFRSRLISKGLLPKCLKLLNEELERLGIKLSTGRLVLDSTIIEAAARPRNIVTVEDKSDDDNDGASPPAAGSSSDVTRSKSADSDAAWTVKANHNYYGYKEHALVDAERGFIEDIEVTPANTHDGKMLKPMLRGRRGVRELLADKAYASKLNRGYLELRNIKDSILRKAARNRPLSERDLRHNRKISKERYIVEQQFGTKKRKFRYDRTRYFGLERVRAQSYLKALCLNLLKAVRFLFPPQQLARA